MFDPMTLAFDVRLPFGKRRTLFMIWHNDPCKGGGGDDSCGWSYPRLNDKQRQAIKDLAFWEGRERHYLRYPFKTYPGDIADREVLYRALILLVARVLQLDISFDQAAKMAALKFAVGGCDGADGTFCYLAGYHSNYKEDRQEDRQQHWQGVCMGIARQILSDRRKWWQHPRWHVRHWKIHIPAVKFVMEKLGTART
jgi:hypothetical protein